MTEQFFKRAENNVTRVSVCTRMATLDQHVKTYRVPVRICNMTGKAITII